MVDQVCRIIRRDPRPFGGMQVVFSGDFFQLPPVSVSGRNNDVIAPAPEFVAARERYAKPDATRRASSPNRWSGRN